MIGVEMITAFVLVNVNLGKGNKVLKKLGEIEEIKEAHLLEGVYDIITRVQSDTKESLRKILYEKVRRTPDVRSTLTLIIQ